VTNQPAPPEPQTQHGANRGALASASPSRATLLRATCLFFLWVWSLSLHGAQARKATAPVLDGNAAFDHVEKLVSFGPRPPGSPGSALAQAYISKILHSLSLEVEYQDFLASTPNGPVTMKNLVGKLAGEQPQALILASHYDTLLVSNSVFLGANDGGSSSGLLLELARVLSKRRNTPPGTGRGTDTASRSTVWFVFFDGEEAQRQWSETDGIYGSRYFVNKLRHEGGLQHIKAVVLMDMVGDRDLRIENDLSSTPWLMELVKKSAMELGYAKHLAATQKGIVDDHIPFIRAGIPAVDLIDYDFGFNNSFWHTPNDTLDKLSPRSLKIVGDIVLRTVEKLSSK
jgi:glutaminyl-peptide cyclotransferase